MITVKYFSYSGNHPGGQDSTSHGSIGAEHCHAALQIARLASERKSRRAPWPLSFSGETVEITAPRVCIGRRDSCGTEYEITASAKTWRLIGAHV